MLQIKYFFASLLFGAVALLSSCSKDDEAVMPVQPQQQSAPAPDAPEIKGGRMESGRQAEYAVKDLVRFKNGAASIYYYNLEIRSRNGQLQIFHGFPGATYSTMASVYSAGFNSVSFTCLIPTDQGMVHYNGEIHGRVLKFFWTNLANGSSGSGYGTLTYYQ